MPAIIARLILCGVFLVSCGVCIIGGYRVAQSFKAESKKHWFQLSGLLIVGINAVVIGYYLWAETRHRLPPASFLINSITLMIAGLFNLFLQSSQTKSPSDEKTTKVYNDWAKPDPQ